MRRIKFTPTAAVLAAIFAIYLAGRVVIAAGGEVLSVHDSSVYRYDPERNFGPLVSLIGNAPRPWGLPLFYAPFPNDEARALGQWALGMFAWAVLAWELTRHMRTAVGKAFGFAAVLGFALLNAVQSWDFAILTESLSISIGVLVTATFLRWARTGSMWSLTAMVALTVWWTFLRPDIRVLTFLIVAVLALMAWRAWRSDRGKLLAAIGAAGVLLLGVGWYAAITPAMDRAFKPYDGDAIREDPMPRQEWLFVYRLRVDVSTDPRTQQAFVDKLNMPPCPATQAIIDAGQGWQTAQFARAYRQCPELMAWAKEHNYSYWGSMARQAPGEALRKLYSTTSYSLGGDVYAKTPHVVPDPLQRLVFPSQRHGLPVALVGLVLALAAALAAGAGRSHPLVLKAAAVLTAAGLGSALATVIVHSGEYKRFGIQETLALRVALIFLLAAAIDAFVSRRKVH